MVRIIATIGAIQILLISTNLIRSKVIAVLLGPAGVGVISVVDQGAYLFAQISALSIPFATVKFLSRAHSQGHAAFNRTYSVLFRMLLGLTCAGAAIGLAVTAFKPDLLGPSMPAYRALLIPAFLSIPSMALHAFLSSVLAAAQKPRAAAILGLCIGIAFTISTVLGISLAGTLGLYWGNWLAGMLVVVSVLIYLRRKLNLSFWDGSYHIPDLIREYPDTLTFPLILYGTSITYGLSLLVARLAILQNFNETEAGLLQAAIALSGTLNLLLNPANGLYLTPLVNRQIPEADKIRAALEFQGRLGLAMGMIAMPIVLFPQWLVVILYAPSFANIATVIFAFVQAQCLTQLAGVYQALLIGLDDLRVYGLSLMVSHLVLGTISWFLAPRYGIWGVALGLLGSSITILFLTLARLAWKHKLALPSRLVLFIGYTLFSLLLAGILSNQFESASPLAILTRIAAYLAFGLSLFFFMSKQDQQKIMLKLQQLVYQFG